MICAEKIADGRVPLPARSGYISENRGTVLGESRHGRVYPAVFRTRKGESGRRPIRCVRFTLQIRRYPAVSCFDQGIYPVVTFTHIFFTFLLFFQKRKNAQRVSTKNSTSRSTRERNG